ncbi:MAG: phosphate acyltransferase [Chloroflexota bacterium]|jgi:glycerol-3-phosphate acyltransferase PlsX|nr:phosphate acyltransferase [Chloroflexota bacterium]
MSTVRVALDAMGGDNAPTAVVAGGLAALAADPGLQLQLVGREAELRAILGSGRPERLSLVNATEVVGMDEHPASAVRTKKDSSINVGARQVAEGKADAFVSAGNSGGIMAAAIFVMKRLPGLDRPAIGTPIPTKVGQTLLIDSGANTDVRPEYLYQWALLGDAYARHIFKVDRPRVALLSNGEEDTKGNELTLASHALLRGAPVNFVGNIEGRAMFGGSADVVITDGFTGNVVLKTIEGVADMILSGIRDAAMASMTGKVGGLLLRPNLQPLRDRADWRKHGGAPLLGVNGVCIIAHGRSDEEATKNAVLRGAEAARSGLVRAMADALAAGVTEARSAG